MLAATLLVVAGAHGQGGDALTGVRFERVFVGIPFDDPVFITHAGDRSDRLFVVEQRGVIVAVSESTPGEPATFLDISDRVNRGGSEEGLLGLAFDPAFAENGRFFVYYSAAGPRRSVLSRFERLGDGANSDSELVILEIEQPYRNHNGGMIAFGPDGHLYVGLGDGGSADDPQGNGQDPSTLLGSVLRIDVGNASETQPYVAPRDNPFASDGRGRPEVWAYGLRNPWRFSFDRETGDLWAGDVGQNQFEEIDVVRAGANYGWNTMEGAHCFERSVCDQSGLTLPVAEYSHAQGCSVTGGYVYRGSAVPSLAGWYVYGDFCTGRIWAVPRRRPAGPGGGRDRGFWLLGLVLRRGRQWRAVRHRLRRQRLSGHRRRLRDRHGWASAAFAAADSVATRRYAGSYVDCGAVANSRHGGRYAYPRGRLGRRDGQDGMGSAGIGGRCCGRRHARRLQAGAREVGWQVVDGPVGPRNPLREGEERGAEG